MSIFKMLKAVVERVDRIHRNSLWEGQGDKNKWIEVIKPKWSGELGLGSL